MCYAPIFTLDDFLGQVLPKFSWPSARLAISISREANERKEGTNISEVDTVVKSFSPAQTLGKSINFDLFPSSRETFLLQQQQCLSFIIVRVKRNLATTNFRNFSPKNARQAPLPPKIQEARRNLKPVHGFSPNFEHGRFDS